MANLEAYGEKVVGLTGSVVSWTQTQASGTKIAEIDIDGTTTDVYAPSGGGSSLNYSTTEQVVGTWIDGRPVYQITATKTSFSVANNAEVNIADLTALNIDDLVSLETSAKEGTNLYEFSRTNGIVQIKNGVLTFRSVGSSWSFTWFYANIRYTKTTDTP